jgi:hypothetical protein
VFVDCYCFPENTFEFQKHGSSKPGKRGSLEVRLELVQAPSKSSEVNPEPGQSGGQRAHAVTFNDQSAVISADEAMLPQEDDIDAVFDDADRGAASLSNVKEMSTTEGITDAVNTAMTLTGSDGFTLVCGYVEKLMSVGDVVSEVSAMMAQISTFIIF